MNPKIILNNEQIFSHIMITFWVFLAALIFPLVIHGQEMPIVEPIFGHAMHDPEGGRTYDCMAAIAGVLNADGRFHSNMRTSLRYCQHCQITVKDITVLSEPPDSMMQHYLTKLVDRQFHKREALLSALKSKEDWEQRANTIRDSMRNWAGPFPERTPLNARVTGRIEREDYTIEKILFESRPDFLVSANLYLPKNVSFPRPAVLNVLGHYADGKVTEVIQKRSIAQAKKGFVALTIDFLGQGERIVTGYTRHLHQVIGPQAFLCGTHLFNLMVWDDIRAIDYLVSRPEVDEENICITGTSGGGMMSTYILPFEDRIAVSVPTCNPNTWSSRVHAGLGTDHEQVFFGAFESGIDPRGDPLFTHAPKPLLINATTDDGLNPPGGVWDLSTWLFRCYAAHGMPEKFSSSMVKGEHGYNKHQREAAYAWLLRWTEQNAADFPEEDQPLEKPEDLWASESGNIYDEPLSRKPHELIMDHYLAHRAEWGEILTKKQLNERKERMPEIVKAILHTNPEDMKAAGAFTSSKQTGDIRIRSFIIAPEEGIVLPGILLESTKSNKSGEVILYLNERGKSEILKDKAIVDELLREGHFVCAVDLRGFGETAPDMHEKFWDFLAGKPIFSQRVGDVLSIVNWLKGPDIEAQNIKLWASGLCSLYGTFAGVFHEDISAFLLEKPLISFESVVKVQVPEYNYEILLPGILEKFDMPQLYQVLSPRPVTLINPQSGDKTIAAQADAEKLDRAVSPIYKMMGQARVWNIKKIKESKRTEIIAELLK